MALINSLDIVYHYLPIPTIALTSTISDG